MLSILIYVVMKLPESLLKSKLPKKKKSEERGTFVPLTSLYADIL